MRESVLPMAAATAVESASTMKSTSAPSVKSAAANAAAREAARRHAAETAAKARTTRETATAETITAEAATAIESTAEEAASAEPWASADKEAIHEPIRAVVAIGSAGVRIIIVIAVRADGSWTVVAICVWGNAEGKADPHLRVGASREGRGENSKQNRVF